MKKKNLFFGGLLMFAMAFSTVALIACGDDDKENEEVVDPLETEKEYYIVGTVTATGGALTGGQGDARFHVDRCPGRCRKQPDSYYRCTRRVHADRERNR